MKSLPTDLQYSLKNADMITLRKTTVMTFPSYFEFEILPKTVRTVDITYIQTAMKLESTCLPFLKHNKDKQHGRSWSGLLLFTHLSFPLLNQVNRVEVNVYITFYNITRGVGLDSIP